MPNKRFILLMMFTAAFLSCTVFAHSTHDGHALARHKHVLPVNENPAWITDTQEPRGSMPTTGFTKRVLLGPLTPRAEMAKPGDSCLELTMNATASNPSSCVNPVGAILKKDK